MTETAIELCELEVTNEQLNLAKTTVAKDLNDGEFQMFLYNCKRQGIHPLDGMLIPIPRTDNGVRRLTFVTTVDLLRSRAADTGEYAGSDDAIIAYSEGGQPESATITVWRLVQGVRCAFTATARWVEYFPGEKQGFMWKQKPHIMVAKCAEALALRKAFPKQLAGLYLSEELEQDESPELDKPKAAKKQAKPQAQVKCPQCNATGGHLPSCPSRTPGVVEAKPIEVKREEKKPKPLGVDVTQGTVRVTTVEERSRKIKDSKGNDSVQPYFCFECVDPQQRQFKVFVWHKHMFPSLAGLIGKQSEIQVSSKDVQGTTYYSLEKIVSVDGLEYVNDAPPVETLPQAPEESPF